MDNKQYNEQRYKRKKNLYRFVLGAQQLMNYPVLNLIWVLFAVGVVCVLIGEKKLIENIEIHPLLITIFSACMTAILIVLSIICAIGLIQFIGYCFAVKDEADIELAVTAYRDGKYQPPILMHKKKDRKSGVIKREFYTTIPMERWQEKKEAICDSMDIYLISDITYGGRKKNKGRQVYFESTQGRKPMERGVLYDDIF
ncbi:MAG: hypothetical protein J6J44_01010 [Lachnospiraceae bacterium]|nr:hypothetical protein [Lachnospiraceae bacterium]